MKFSSVSIALLCITVTSCASVESESTDSLAVQVPMELVNRFAVLTVRIDEYDIRLHLDTGSGTTLTLYPEVLDKIDTIATGEVHKSIGMEGVVMENAQYVVSKAELGEAIFENLQIRRDDHSAKHRTETIKGRGTYGRIGLGLLEGQKIVIDYPNQSLTIIPPEAPSDDQALCHGVELLLDTEKASLGLVTTTQTDIGLLSVIWDTGAPGNIMLKQTTDAAGLSLQARDRFDTETFTINGHEFGPVQMRIWDIPAFPPDMHSLVGYWWFSDKIVCLDLPRNRIYVRFPKDT